VIAELGASAAVPPDATEDEYQEPPHHLGADAERLADPAPDVRARDAQALPPERLAQRAGAAPCKPAEVPSGEQSSAATAIAIA